jgi:hypothetical protein
MRPANRKRGTGGPRRPGEQWIEQGWLTRQSVELFSAEIHGVKSGPAGPKGEWRPADSTFHRPMFEKLWSHLHGPRLPDALASELDDVRVLLIVIAL